MFITLMYHLVDAALIHPMSIPQSSFSKQLDLLTSFATIVNLKQAEALLDGAETQNRAVLLTFDDGYKNTIEVVLPELQKREMCATLAVCSSYLQGEIPLLRHPSADFASVRDVEGWLSCGNDIAGHSRTHARLPELTAEQLSYEVASDKAGLDTLFNRNLTSFVYPFGAYSAQVMTEVGKHYKTAFSDGNGGHPDIANRLKLHRLRVRPEWSLETFEAKVSQLIDAVTAHIGEGNRMICE